MSAARNRRTPEEIEASLAVTRERLAADIGAIQDRLRPDRIKREISGKVRQMVLHNVGTLLRFAKRNPVPAVMIGAGVGWLLVRNGRD